MNVGTIQEIWRYPVKSMRGEKLEAADAQKLYGIPGDRGWAIRDDEIGEIRNAKRIPEMLQLAARYLEEPEGALTPPVEIDLGNGETIRSDAEDINEVLQRRLNLPISLWPRQPVDNLDHYRRMEHLDDVKMREVMGLLPDEPLPSWFDTASKETLDKVAEFVAPPGTYFDGAEMHLVSTASLSTFSKLMPESMIDARRFRPNIVLNSIATDGYPEIEWCGKSLRIGSAVIKIAGPMVRCAMVTHPQEDIPKDPKIMRTLVRETEMNFGASLSVIEPGSFQIGDTVELI